MTFYKNKHPTVDIIIHVYTYTMRKSYIYLSLEYYFYKIYENKSEPIAKSNCVLIKLVLKDVRIIERYFLILILEMLN